MTDLIIRFENELKNKLAFKASSKVSMDALLFRTFKFFDLSNVGFVPQNEFYRTIAKVGVVFETPEIMKQVFEHYDRNKQGKIFYKDFINEVLFQEKESDGVTDTISHQAQRPSLTHQPNSMKVEISNSRREQPLKPTNPIPSNASLNTIADIFDYIKQYLRSIGIDSLLSTAVRLKELDLNKTHRLSIDQVHNVLSWLTKQQLATLFSYFKLPIDGHLNYAQFIYCLIDPTTPERTALINTTFEKLADVNNEISIDELLKKYRQNSLVEKFLYDRACYLYCKFQSIEDGVFTYEDFQDFVSFIGFGFTVDQRFRSWILQGYSEEEQVRSTKSSRNRREFQQESKSQSDHADKRDSVSVQLAQLKLDTNIQQPPPEAFKKPTGVQRKQKQNRQNNQVSERSSVKPQSSASSHYLKEMELILLRIKRRIASKGANGYAIFEKALRAIDTDSDMLVSMHEFKKVIKDQRIDITETEASMVFEVFDQQGTGLLNYPEFVYAVRGEVPKHRQKLIDRVFDKVRLAGQDYTSFDEIRRIFKARRHPDIKNGRKFEQDIISDMTQSLLCVQDLNGVRSQQISRDDFVEYMQNLSSSIADDQLFESILINVWQLDSVNRIEDEYAGSKKRFDMKTNSYLIDHHRYMINGGSVSQNAPFGTYTEPSIYKQK